MNWLKELKSRFNLTQKSFSEITGIPKSTVEAWERGTRQSPEWLPKMIECYLVSQIDPESRYGSSKSLNIRKSLVLFAIRFAKSPALFKVGEQIFAGGAGGIFHPLFLRSF
mgnify:CR=1 FL=1